MGCGVSVNIEQNLNQLETKLIIVDWGNADDDDHNDDHDDVGGDDEVDGQKDVVSSAHPSIEVYSLQKRFEYENSIDLPVLLSTKRHGAFSITCHAVRPSVYLTGEVVSEDVSLSPCGALWKANVADQSGCKADIVCDLLPAQVPHVSCVCIQQNHEYLYLIGRDKSCVRMNLETKDCDELEDIPLDMDDIICINSCQGVLVFTMEDNDIWCFDPPLLPNDRWTLSANFQLPRGKIAVTSQSIYFFQLDDISIYKCDTRGKLTKIVIVDLSTTAAQRTTHLIVCGEFAYLLGHLHSMERVSLLEIHLIERYSIVAGYLNGTSSNYDALLCISCK